VMFVRSPMLMKLAVRWLIGSARDERFEA
jgi:hypothetical protein